MRLFIVATAALFFFAADNMLAKEPANLIEAKNAIIKYHDSGEYERDIEKTIADAMRYLKLSLEKGMPQGKKPAIVLDIDETALSNYDDMLKMNFGGTYEQIREAETKGTDPAIKPTLKLYRFAKDNKVAVFFITGRKETERDATIKNLEAVGYHGWEGLILRNGDHEHDSAVQYKSAMRAQIEKEGYHIILNIGDQKSDLTGTNTGKGFKLPGPFYFIK